MSRSSVAKNLERITASVEEHDSNCESKAKAVLLNPFELDRLGFDSVFIKKDGRWVPIKADDTLSTGLLRVVCDGYHVPKREEEVKDTVEAPEPAERELVPTGAPSRPRSEPSSDPETDLLEFARRAFEEVGTQKNHWPFPTIIPPEDD